MTGLFEDDKNVRDPIKVVSRKQTTNVGDKLLSIAEGKSNLAVAASSKGGVSFGSIDLVALERSKKTAAKNEEGKISPLIDYLNDGTP